MTDQATKILTVETKGTTLTVNLYATEEKIAMFAVANNIVSSIDKVSDIFLYRLVSEDSEEKDLYCARVAAITFNVDRNALVEVSRFLQLPIIEEC